MLKKLSTVFTLLIAVFASLADAPLVFADTTVLYESYESGGVIQTNPGSGSAVLIGTFEVDTYTLFDEVSGVYAGFRFSDPNAGSWGCGNCRQIAVASSTSQYISSGFIWTDNGFDASSASYVWKETTNSGPGEGPVWLVPGHTYGIYFYQNGGASPISITADSNNLIYYGYFSWDGNYASEFNENASLTRVISVDPTHNETVATSTNFVLFVEGYVNEIDFTEDVYLRIKYIRNQDLQAQVANTEVLWTTIDIPLLNSGAFATSTTVNIQETGTYTYVAEIKTSSLVNTVLSWFGLSNLYDPGLLAENRTSFIVVEPTLLDVYINQVASTTEDILFNSTSTASQLVDNCNPFSGFDVFECIKGLFIPNQTQISTLMTSSRDLILTKAPLGYLTRAITLLSDTATSSLPQISYTFGPQSPLAGQELAFDFNSVLSGASVILNDTLVSDNAEPESAMDIFMPFWTLLCYLGLVFMIVHDVVGINLKLKHRKL